MADQHPDTGVPEPQRGITAYGQHAYAAWKQEVTNHYYPASSGQGQPRIPMSDIVQAVSAGVGVLLAGLGLHWSVLRTASLLVAAVSAVTTGYGWRLRGRLAHRWVTIPALLCAAALAAFGLSFLPAIT